MIDLQELRQKPESHKSLNGEYMPMSVHDILTIINRLEAAEKMFRAAEDLYKFLRNNDICHDDPLKQALAEWKEAQG